MFGLPRFRSSKLSVDFLLPVLTLALGSSVAVSGRGQVADVRNAAGVEMAVETADGDPALRITVPDGPADQRSFDVLFPEHVTARLRGSREDQRLYLFKPGLGESAPKWERTGQALRYTSDFGEVHLIASATLLPDGILFRYEFRNDSANDFDRVYAVTDPRFSAVFYDPRLERTYVHHRDGFDLLASETPERLTMPLSQWLPVRYHAQFTAEMPPVLSERRADGITYIYKSRRVDLPMIATLSADRTWVAASFSRDPGNVWSNPELTCQHVDPQVALPRGARAAYEVKILIFKGSLEDALGKVREQRMGLRQDGAGR